MRASAALLPDFRAPSRVAWSRWSPHTYRRPPSCTGRIKSVGGSCIAQRHRRHTYKQYADGTHLKYRLQVPLPLPSLEGLLSRCCPRSFAADGWSVATTIPLLAVILEPSSNVTSGRADAICSEMAPMPLAGREFSPDANILMTNSNRREVTLSSLSKKIPPRKGLKKRRSSNEPSSDLMRKAPTLTLSPMVPVELNSD
ncbi:MAG: hypothetical protein FRX49_11568 [Trebouxia sp. A1-2]|nr:MAG: hypothetical protein FRX49_11568 [Trebouxia sp. A1-2]